MSYALPGRLRRQIRLRQSALTKFFVSLLQFFLVYYLMTSKVGEFINNAQLQTFFALRKEVDTPKDILIAAIDDDSFINEDISGLQAWPRKLEAEVLENLRDAGAKFVVMDILFDPTTSNSEADPLLTDAIKKIPSSIAMFEYLTKSKDLNGRVKFKNNLNKPKQEFIESAKFTIPMMVKLDTDGNVRRFYYSNSYIKKGKIPLPLAEVWQHVSGKKIIKYPKKNEYINYYGPSGSFPTISINKLLTKNIDDNIKENIKNKIVFIGTFRATKVESKSEDQFTTDFGYIFGAEIHATVLANLIQENWIKKYDIGIELFIIFTISTLCSYISISAGPLWGSIFSIFSAISLFIISYFLFLSNQFLPCLSYCFVISPILIIGILAFHYVKTFKAFKSVEEALGVSLLKPKK